MRPTRLLLALSAAPILAATAQDRPNAGREREKPLPLTAARKASFTATKATWMSLDVSPDGKTIVFDLLGDLYTLPIEGGKATRITEGLAFDAQPRFSPDGESIVFISDRSGGDNVWVMRLDFTDTTQVTQGNTSQYVSPEWMPDGEHIVVSRSSSLFGAAKLQMYHVKRRSPLPVIRTPQAFKTLGAAPTPDGRYIWFAGRSGDWDYNALFPQYQLYRYDRETGNTTQPPVRLGLPARGFARWKRAGIRNAGRRGDRAPGARSQYRRGTLARLSHPARRPGVSRDARRIAGLQLHARLSGDRHLVWR
jgi:dipeptidyl aminopeptidase/acylaminoacyl peptidase